MTEKKNGSPEDNLLSVLLEKNVLSHAQVEVAKIDIAATGLAPVDVLLARKWITEQTLAELAKTGSINVTARSTPEPTEKTGSHSTSGTGSGTPAVGTGAGAGTVERVPGSPSRTTGAAGGGSRPNSENQATATSSEQTYLDNLRKYRQLMSQIMGQTD